MLRGVAILAVLCLVLPAMPAVAQGQAADRAPVAIGESGEAYLRAIRLRQIDSDVAYFDPDAPAPDLQTRALPETEDDPLRPSPDTVDTTVVLIAIAVLAAIVYLAVRYGGAVTVMRGAPGAAARAPRGQAALPRGDAGAPQGLAEILRMADRGRAIVHLAQAALNASIAAQGGLFQDSWTARDALRHLPPTMPHRAALQELVLTSERVKFGGRGIDEAEFNDHVARIRPLFHGGAA